VVAASVSPSVVSIQVSGATGQGEGSGVILDDEGHILTNNHVVTGAGLDSDIVVASADGRAFADIELVGADPGSDLAVLKIANPPDDLTAIAMGDSSKVEVGQLVMAVGSPLGLADTVTTGIVSALDRPVVTSGDSRTSNETVVTNAIQTDAAINPGNSGGALVDASGALVGVPSSIASMASGRAGAGAPVGSIGLGFAIPSNEAQRVAQELIENGQASSAFLGVNLGNGTARADGVIRVGAEITGVVEGEPADAAGIQQGDLVTSVDGETIRGAEALMAQIRERPPGEQVSLEIVRDGEITTVDATLARRDN
jgi:putative serine protease PepD